jgi:hypothetical protein
LLDFFNRVTGARNFDPHATFCIFVEIACD